MAVVRLVRVEQDPHDRTAAVSGRESGEDLWIGERIDLRQHTHARAAERALEHRPDLFARRGLGNLRRRGRERRGMASGQVPVLGEYAREARNLRRSARLEDVIVIAAAVRAPVTATDASLTVVDQAIHIIAL